MSFLFGLFSRDLTPERYQKQLIAALRDVGITASPVVGQFALRHRAGTIFLQRLYDAHREIDSKKRPAHLRMQARAALKPPEPTSLAEAAGQLLPVVRSRLDASAARLTLKLQGHDDLAAVDYAVQPLAGNLEIGVALDTEEAMRRVTCRQVQEWGTTLDQMLEIALSNLRKHSTEARLTPLEGGVYQLQFDGDYECSLLLLPPIFSRVPMQERVFLIVDRDLVLMADATTPGVFDMLARYGESVFDQRERALMAEVLRYQDGQWSVYMLSPERSDHTALRNLQVRAAYMDYQSQKTQLDALHDRNGVDIMVATFMAISGKQDNVHSSACTWGQGACSWLPRTEQLCLVEFSNGEPGQTRFYRWEDFESRLGHYLKKLDMHPPRYEVNAWPTPEELASVPTTR